jgi:hypothetical protein
MLFVNRTRHIRRDPPDVSSVGSSGPRPLLRNFNLCPHCQKRRGPYMLERLNEWGPVISRSDGVSFHLVLGDRPLEYPAERTAGKTEIMSVGFWYVHEANAGSTETVVVILLRPPADKIAILRHLETLADKLAEKLQKSSRLPCLYEFGGQHLQEVVH